MTTTSFEKGMFVGRPPIPGNESVLLLMGYQLIDGNWYASSLGGGTLTRMWSEAEVKSFCAARADEFHA